MKNLELLFERNVNWNRILPSKKSIPLLHHSIIPNAAIIINCILLFTMMSSTILLAQDFIFFSDSPNSTYFDASTGFSSNSSIVDLKDGKFPVDVNNMYSGNNALRLRWKSVPGGDWGIGVGEIGLTSHDVTAKDTLTFWVLSKANIDSVNLPIIYLEDANSNKTSKQNFHTSKIDANNWTKISIPLKVFIDSPGNADLTKIKYIYFGQNASDGSLRTIYLDEIRMVSASDTDYTAPAVPQNFSGKEYTTYVYLSWKSNTEDDIAGYRIYRSDGSDFKLIYTVPKNATYFNDNIGIPPKSYSYKISAFDLKGNESALSDQVSISTTSLPDSVLLDMVQEATFKYFWDYAHPVSGLTRERLGSGDVVTSGGSGFGVMAILVGVERDYITRQEAKTRMLKILNFLTAKAEKFHGAFSHWLNGSTGKAIPFSTKDDGGDLVETAYMIQGLLTARMYFNQDDSEEEQIRNLITAIWENVEWDWYRRTSTNTYLYWHWSPNYNWEMNHAIRGFNETMITYLLAIASPTHSVPASLYHNGWAGSVYRNGKTFYGIKLDVGPDYGGPLFFTHYSFLGFDPRNKKDQYTNYFINNRNCALIHQAYSEDNPKNYPGYDADTWGLTASDNPFGYGAHSPTNDNGTITPSAALSSIPYTPEESINALKSFHYIYGSSLWGEYGFKDAFNLKEGWYATSYLAIDQGPIIIMIENYRSGLLWKYFMANPEIQPMLDAIGFVPDSTVTDMDEKKTENPSSFQLLGNYPNPFNPTTTIEFSIPAAQSVTITIHDILGRQIRTFIKNDLSAGIHKVTWNGKNDFGIQVSSGVYLYRIKYSYKIYSGKMLLQK